MKLPNSVKKEFDSIIYSIPSEMRPNGGTIFLGSEFANKDLPKILHLGLNPGGKSNHEKERWGCDFYFDLLSESPLLEITQDEKKKKWREPYWDNARAVYTKNKILALAMRKATFSFVYPVRTENSNDWRLKTEEVRGASAKIMMIIIKECEPEFIILSGKAARTSFIRLLWDKCAGFKEINGPKEIWDDTAGSWWPDAKPKSSIYQWSTTDVEINGLLTKLVKIPHHSRANSYNYHGETAGFLSKVIFG